jgi:hypothetical protein
MYGILYMCHMSFLKYLPMDKCQENFKKVKGIMYTQPLWNRSFRRFLMKWKDYLQDEALGSER